MSSALGVRRWVCAAVSFGRGRVGPALARGIAAGCVLVGAAQASRGDQIVLAPVADNTMYSESGSLSNGAGNSIFAGVTDQGGIRRALVRFDLSAIPPGSTVNSVQLTMYCSRTRTQAVAIGLHRALASWGEGASHAGGEEGAGGGAATGDATWMYRFYDTQAWATAGGEFAPTASATLSVDNANTFYTWTSAGMAADVQMWVDSPAGNHGWVVRANETVRSAKRFESRQSTNAAQRPMLVVDFTPGGASGACCLPGGVCVITTQLSCTNQGGIYQGDGTVCTPNPCPQPTGACCLAGNVCTVLTAAECAAQGGIYRGDNVPCNPNPCGAMETITIIPAKDNTLYESATGALSNGSGIGFFAGTDNQGARRRGVLAFDLAAIPSGATITGATLQMTVGYTQATAADAVTLHRVLADWGEGASDAGGNESGGATSTAGDATWIHRFYNTVLWGSPGGDFMAAPSASTSVGTTLGAYLWSGPGMVADIQSWVNDPAANFGWLVATNEAATRTQRRFESSENANAALRPMLMVMYTVGAATGACCLGGGVCTELTEAECVGMGGVYQGDGTPCTPNPCPQPTGACCFNTASCLALTEADCVAQGGTYQGDAVPCTDGLCPLILEPFVDALPIPPLAQPVGGEPGGMAEYVIPITAFYQQLHRDLPPTRLYGYAGMFPGPTILARRGLPVMVTWINDLRDEMGNLLQEHEFFIDPCLHGPDEFGTSPRTIVHLHGGVVPEESDGFPDDAFGPGQQLGPIVYPNEQPAALIWYHDHALGITRLNVMMGMAGGYIIRDDLEEALNPPLPGGEFEVPLVIQDRAFNPDGSLSYPAIWEEHFFGDVMLVNGKVWPYMNVKQGKYRFRTINGCNSRTLTLGLSNGQSFQQISTDTGLKPEAVTLSSVTFQPAERGDFIIDFSGLAPGTEVVLTNSAPAPFPGDPGVGVIPQVMKFIVTAEPGFTGAIPQTLVPVEPIPEAAAVRSRDFVLRRTFDPHCNHDMWLINDLMWDDITEFPRLGSVEIWNWINRSGVSHPMHMHLVSFQVLDRQDFDVVGGEIVPVGPRIPPSASEVGWKDTVQATPNQITRVITRFEGYTGFYPYHCHILEHEDHEMMRQFRTTCAADWNTDLTVNSNDISAFLTQWLSSVQLGNLVADFNGDMAVNSNDISAFLTAWLASVSGGC